MVTLLQIDSLDWAQDKKLEVKKLHQDMVLAFVAMVP